MRTHQSRKQPEALDAGVDGLAIEKAVGAAAVDRNALVASLFRQEGVALVRLARFFTDDRNAAEDLVQEAFVRLYRSAHRIEDPEKAAPYLRSILLNLARDHNRRGLMSLRHAEALAPTEQPAGDDDRLVLDEQKAEVVAALESLPTRQRDCILLRFYFDLSERDIGATLDISPNSVKTHCRRAMASLRKKLGEPL